MNVLVINGSPKGEGSNTLRLTRAFCEGLTEGTDSSVNVIPVYQMDIQDCKGCFACWSKTPGICCIRDDMEEVIKKILLADVVIWSFPLYYFSLPSRLKALMDRLLPMNLPFMSPDSESGSHPDRYDMSAKRYVVISTCGFYTADGNYRAVEEQFARIYGKKGYTQVCCGQGELFRVAALKARTGAYLENVRRAGAEFRSGGITPETRARLSELLYPKNVFEQMADADWGIQAAESGPDRIAAEVDLPLNFTTQMAALYNPETWEGRDKVLEFHYTDVGRTYQIVLKRDGQTVLTDHFLPFSTRIETPLSVWRQIAKGEITGDQALFEHKYTVSGDFDILLHWEDYFGYQRSDRAAPKSSEDKKTNMSSMLIPWIVIWALLPVEPVWGGAAGILAAACIPFTFLKWKATVFECVTIFSAAAISLISVLNGPARIWIPFSYGVFGVMWMVTVFQKYPLTAYYSMNQYGGERALSNPLFVRTNRILTAAWGGLYLITPVWTYFILRSDSAWLSGAMNSVLPALLGVFTAWFQKWYPRRYARIPASVEDGFGESGYSKKEADRI